jgi:outer membrane protein
MCNLPLGTTRKHQNHYIMKKIFTLTVSLSLLIAGLLSTVATQAQRYGIVDTKYILDKMPEYKEAQKKLDQFSIQWQKEIDDKQAALDKMYKDYDAEQVMLSEELKKKREDELFVREKELRDLQRKRFGFEGDLFKRRQELVKPVQDKVYNAIQKIAVNRAFDFILDKSEGITIIFADPKLDKSEDVLKELGVKN